MPLNESKGKVRERWPLEFDLEAIPRDTKTRNELLQKDYMNVPESQNNFAVAYGDTMLDMSAPVRRNYNPNAPENQYPKMVYSHDTGRTLTVASAAEEKAALKKGYQLKPSPEHDYSKMKHGVAPKADNTPNPSVADVVADDSEVEAAEAELAEYNKKR